MKKIYLALLAMLALSVAASAEVGIGIKGGLFQQSDNLKDSFAFGTTKIDNDKYFGGVELLFQDYFTQDSMLGFKLGAEARAQLKMTDKTLNADIKNNFYSFPITLYYKYAPPCAFVNIWVGGGVTAALSKWTFDAYNPPASSDSASNLIVYPHLNAGIEFRPTENLGFGFDLGYNFAAKTSEDFGEVPLAYQRDLSGLEGNIAVRLYF